MPKKFEWLQVEIDRVLKEKLKDRAWSLRTSMSDHVRELIRKDLESVQTQSIPETPSQAIERLR